MANSIPDMFIRIKNAYRAGHETVLIPYSKFRHEIAKVLERTGYIKDMERKGKRVRKVLEITLRYDKDDPALHDVKFISRPSRKVYLPYKSIQGARHGGIVIVSTPKGVLSNKEVRKEKVGGELIAEVW